MRRVREAHEYVMEMVEEDGKLLECWLDFCLVLVDLHAARWVKLFEWMEKID